MKKEFKIAGVSFLISLLSTISFGFFVKAIGILFDSFFLAHAAVIAWISGFATLFFVIVGLISIKTLVTGAKARIF